MYVIIYKKLITNYGACTVLYIISANLCCSICAFMLACITYDTYNKKNDNDDYNNNNNNNNNHTSHIYYSTFP